MQDPPAKNESPASSEYTLFNSSEGNFKLTRVLFGDYAGDCLVIAKRDYADKS